MHWYSKLFDRLGNWNPQLYREIKGRVRWQSVISTAILSFFFQALLIFVKNPDSYSTTEVYYREIFYTLNWLLPMGAGAIGVYLLSRDLCRERERGTLEFIRLSPQPSEKILLGKLLGVPILLYFAIALTLPLHLTAAFSAGADLALGERLRSLSVMYLAWSAIASIFYNLALLISLQSNPKHHLRALPAFLSGISLLLICIVLLFLRDFLPGFDSIPKARDWHWFFLPQSFASPWFLGTLFVLNFWVWKLVNSAFVSAPDGLRNPNQSYWTIGCTHFWLLGFAFPSLVVNPPHGGILVWGIYLLAIPLIHLRLISLLFPSTEKEAEEGLQQKEWIFTEPVLQVSALRTIQIQLHLIVVFLLWMPWLVAYSYSNSNLY